MIAGVPALDQRLHPLIVLGGDVSAPGHAEGGDFRVLQIQVAHRAKVGGVLGVGKRITSFDIVESRFVEPGRDQQLVLKREIDSLTLAAVAQRGVVNEDSRHGVDRLSPRERPVRFGVDGRALIVTESARTRDSQTNRTRGSAHAIQSMSVVLRDRLHRQPFGK